MSAPESVEIVSPAEIEAALAEAAVEVQIPNLDDDRKKGIVAVPVDAHVRPLPRPGPTDTAPAAPAAAADGTPAAETPAPSAGPHSLAYRIADVALSVINWPFRWLGPGARSVIGLLGVVTLVMSVLAVVLLPRLAPNPPPFTEVRRPTAARPAEPAATPHAESAGATPAESKGSH